MAPEKRVIKQAGHPGDDRRVRQVEHVPAEAADVEMHEIGDRPIGEAIDRIADRAADDQPERERREAGAGAGMTADDR